MTELLTEAKVLAKVDWPSREYLNARMRHDGFPRPVKRMRGIGDQWRKDQVERWTGIEAPEDGSQALIRRFEEMGKAG